MPEKTPRSITTPSEGSWFSQLGLRIKLVLKLVGDRRVSPFLKLLPIGSLLYLVFPEMIVGPILATPLDDALVIWLATSLFVELCPTDIVQEHQLALGSHTSKEWNPSQPPDDVVDGDFVEEKEAKASPDELEENER